MSLHQVNLRAYIIKYSPPCKRVAIGYHPETIICHSRAVRSFSFIEVIFSCCEPLLEEELLSFLNGNSVVETQKSTPSVIRFNFSLIHHSFRLLSAQLAS